MRNIVAAALLLSAFPLCARVHQHGQNLTINVDSDRRVTECSQIDVLYGRERIAMTEENVSGVRGLRSLSVKAPQNGGVYVLAADDSAYSVKACKAVWDGNARDVTTQFRGGELTANIPDDVDGVVYFIVRAPRGAALELDSHNGPVDVVDFDGTLNAHSHNGPIDLRNVGGNITADAHNGPIGLTGGSGIVKLDAQNGPISVKLDGRSWLGGSLDAHAHNGPMTVRLPSDYRSGVVVESDGHGPFSCRAEGCRGARQRWANDDDDSPRRVEFGSGPAIVRLSATNGPVAIRDRE